MAITTRATLLLAMRDWLARAGDTASLPDAALEDMIVFAEADINAMLDVPAREALAELTFVVDAAALPTDFMKARRLYLVDTPGVLVEYYTPGQFWEMFAGQPTGRPYAYTIEAGRLIVGPSPDTTREGHLLYYKRLTLPNVLLTNHPDLYLYGALRHLALYTGDDARSVLWQAGYAAAVERVRQEGFNATYGAAPLIMRSA